MSHDPNAEFDHTVLDRIEQSSHGLLPSTPAYQDALRRLYEHRQVYVHADHPGGHVTARTLAKLPSFVPQNLDELIDGSIAEEALESNASIYDRYVASLPEGNRSRAESYRVKVIGKPIQHRLRQGATVVHDPLHMLFLVPGAGPNIGLPGNYLHCAVFHIGPDAETGAWVVQVHDSEDGAAEFKTAKLADALAVVQDVLASAPFHLSELEGLGFAMK